MIGLSTVVDVYDNAELWDVLDNDAVLRLSRLGGQRGFRDSKALQKSTGIARRRILKPQVTELELGLRLGDRLQQQTGMRLSEFDQILLCHSHTDPKACQRLAQDLEDGFGLPPQAITAFNFGCAGYLKMLTEAVSCFTDTTRRIALLNIETPELWHDASDRLFCGIVSAGATATVLEADGGLPLSNVRSDDFLISPDLRPNPDPLFKRDLADGFDFRGAACRRTVMRMNAEPVFLNGIELMLDSLRSALDFIDRQPGQRVVVLPHQPSGKLLKALIAAAAPEFPDVEVVNNLNDFGNTISATVPTMLSRLDRVLAENELQPLRPGDHLVLLAAGICMREIRNHMSAGYATMQWNPQEFAATSQQQPDAVVEPR